MRKTLFLAGMLLWPVLATAQDRNPEARYDLSGEHVPGQLILRLRNDAGDQVLQAVAASVNASRVWSPWPGKIHALELPESADLAGVLEQMNADVRVQYAEPNFIAHAVDTFPNDPSFSAQYGWHQTNDADIDAPAAWDIATDASSILIVGIDTGILATHNDLAANIWTNPGEIPGNGIDDDGNGFVDDVHGYDFVNDDGNPTDDHGHGTHTAGTVGASTNNGLGVAGACWKATIAAAKFLGSSGSGSYDDAIAATYYCVTIGAQVSNNSWGGGSYSQALYDAIDLAGDAGHLYVAAAGNNGANADNSPLYPAAYDLPEIISVAATDSNDQLASFSNYGLVSVDLGAPGVDILSTWNDGGYVSINGTSMATPHVAGVATMVFAVSGSTDPLEVKQAILDSVDPNADLAGRSVTGGRLNYFGALQEIKPIGFEFPNGVPSIVQPAGGDVVRVEVIARTGLPVAGTGMLHVDWGDGVLDLPMDEVLPNVYDATLPGLPGTECGDSVSYWVSAEATDLVRYTSKTQSAISIAEVTTIESLDFESAPGWSVDDVNLTAGSWDRGVPVGGGDRGDPAQDYDGSGQCWLTQNVDGDSDVDGGPTRLISPVYDLSGLGNEVSCGYARWFTNDDNDSDRLDVEVSADGGSNWVLVESVGSGSGWVNHSFRVADHIALTNAFRIRFSATDNPNNSVTEAGIDAFRLEVNSCPMALAVTAPIADIGDTISLTTWKGKTGAPCLRFVTAFGGVPTLIKLPLGLFNANGDAILTGALPLDPGLHGLDVDFLSIGINRDSRIVATNVARLSIR